MRLDPRIKFRNRLRPTIRFDPWRRRRGSASKLGGDHLDAVDQTAREITFAKPLRERLGDAFPECLAYSLVNAAVAEHGEAPARGDDEERNAVALRRTAHPQPIERALRRFVDIAPKEARDADAVDTPAARATSRSVAMGELADSDMC